MDKKHFEEQIHRLEGAFVWQMPPGAFGVWWSEIQKKEIPDVDLEAGVSRSITECRRFPTMGELLSQISFVAIGRREREAGQEKARHAREQGTTEEAIEKGMRGESKVSRELSANINHYLKGGISVDEMNKRKKTITEKHKG
jgi:predicted transcriptional regulator